MNQEKTTNDWSTGEQSLIIRNKTTFTHNTIENVNDNNLISAGEKFTQQDGLWKNEQGDVLMKPLHKTKEDDNSTVELLKQAINIITRNNQEQLDTLTEYAKDTATTLINKLPLPTTGENNEPQ